MDIGIVRLMATVAISDDVKKHPLLAKQPHLITVKLYSTVLANSFFLLWYSWMKGINVNTRDK
jgi:hypothetical protein